MEGFWDTGPSGSNDAADNGGSSGGSKGSVNLAEQVKIDAVFNQFEDIMLAVSKSSNIDDAYKKSANTLFELAKQLPANKILEIEISKSNWTYLHFACRYNPGHVQLILDKFAPEQLYHRVDTNSGKKESPIKLALAYAKEKNFSGYEVITEIIKRARPEDLASKDGEDKTDLENILRADIQDDWKQNLEKFYLERLEVSPKAPAVIAAQETAVVKITDPRDMVAALIANEKATVLDAISLTKGLSSSFQEAMDRAAYISVDNRNVAQAAITSIQSLHTRMGLIQASLVKLKENPDGIAVSSGIVGQAQQILRRLLPTFDPLKPALITLDSARDLARNASASAQNMIEKQLNIAKNQDQYVQPFTAMSEALKIAIEHYATREDATGQRIYRVFTTANERLLEDLKTLQRLISNTDAAQDCATDVVMVMEDMHTDLNRLAMDIAELATLQTKRDLRDVYNGTNPSIAQAVKDVLEHVGARLELQRNRLPALERQVQEIVLTPLEVKAPELEIVK